MKQTLAFVFLPLFFSCAGVKNQGSKLEGTWVLDRIVIHHENEWDPNMVANQPVDTLIIYSGNYELRRYYQPESYPDSLIYKDSGRYQVDGRYLRMFNRTNNRASGGEIMKEVRLKLRFTRDKMKLGQWVEIAGGGPEDSLFNWLVYRRIE